MHSWLLFMGKHSVPQYYLKGFCDPLIHSNIWVYEKGNNKVFRTNIINVAVENNRWPDDVEKTITDYENMANPVLDKIRSASPLTPNDKEVFSGYLVVMFHRVDEGLKRRQKLLPKLINEVFDPLDKRISELITEHPEKTTKLAESKKVLQEQRRKYEKGMPKELWYYGITPDTPSKIRSVLKDMTWTFLVSNNSNPFLTSDNPVFFFKEKGIGNPDSEITFPISSNIALLATWKYNFSGGYFHSKESITKEINRRTASIATRFVYSSVKDLRLVSLVNKQNWKLNRIV
jgi:hypothetical protein